MVFQVVSGLSQGVVGDLDDASKGLRGSQGKSQTASWVLKGVLGKFHQTSGML